MINNNQKLKFMMTFLMFCKSVTYIFQNKNILLNLKEMKKRRKY